MWGGRSDWGWESARRCALHRARWTLRGLLAAHGVILARQMPHLHGGIAYPSAMAKTAPNFTPQLLINGTSRAAQGGETFDLRHPATGAPIGKIPLASPADVDAAIAAARTAFDDGPWRSITPADRALLLLRLADALAAEADAVADAEVWQTGTAWKLSMISRLARLPT